ncbi:neuroligin-4, X-linked-like [Glandiceps talaboti]
MSLVIRNMNYIFLYNDLSCKRHSNIIPDIYVKMELHKAILLSLAIFPLFNTIAAYVDSYVNFTYVETDTLYGQIRGMRNLRTNGEYLDVYLGVPFAAPPIGDTRFAAPKHPDPWGGVLDTYVRKPACTQTNECCFGPPCFDPPDGIDEDCLYLNIYAPYDEARVELLPVMVWIHGGCFDSFSGEGVEGSIITQNGIILVALNYRLGAMGFLSTGDSVAAGNWGLLDNIMALEWVKGNIANFGGDPNKITIAGQSSGGVQASLLLFSPLSTGLIDSAIIQSGTATSDWGIYRPPYDPRTATNELAVAMNCPTEDSQELVDCLRTKDWVDIVCTPVAANHEWCSWTPNVDGIFITDDPTVLLEKGEFLKVPVLEGFVRDELGYPPATMSKADFDANVRNKVDNQWDYTGNADECFDAFVYEYTEPTDPLNENEIRDQWVHLYTDHHYISPADEHLKGHQLIEPNTYKYNFEFRSIHRSTPIWMGVTHSSELPFEFGFPFTEEPPRSCPWICYEDEQLEFSDADRDMSDFMMILFTNFMKYGDPTPTPVNGITWPPFDDVSNSYLSFSDTSVVVNHYRERQMLYWQDYFLKVAYRNN